MCKKLNYDSAPRNGVYIRGLCFEGGRWDREEQLLVESVKNEFVSVCPILLMKPVPMEEIAMYPFDCPLYRTSDRRENEAYTTSNFVCRIQIPTKGSQEYWEERGAALVVGGGE